MRATLDALWPLVDRLITYSSLLRRFFVFILALTCLSMVISVSHRFGQHYDKIDAVVMVIMLGFGLYFLFACAVPELADRVVLNRRRLVAVTALVSTIVLGAHSWGQISTLLYRLPRHAPYGNDAVIMSACATRILLQGYNGSHNPYQEAGLITCMWDHGYYRDGNLTTPLQQGDFKNASMYPAVRSLTKWYKKWGHTKNNRPPEFESQISYPAGSFLIPALWSWTGGDLRQFFSLCFLLSFLLAIWWTPPILRLVAALLACINMPVWMNAVSGASDAMYALFVLLAWHTRRRPVISAVAMGVAATCRQQSWFFLIFYIVLIWRTYGQRDIGRRLAIIAGIFALTNLPFFVQSPGDWWSGILSPVSDPMFPLGSGTIVLAAADIMPLWSRGTYSLLELLAMAAALAWYVCYCRRWPHTGLVLAVIPLFFAWRSLFSYFYPVSVMMMGAMVEGGLGLSQVLSLSRYSVRERIARQRRHLAPLPTATPDHRVAAAVVGRRSHRGAGSPTAARRVARLGEVSWGTSGLQRSTENVTGPFRHQRRPMAVRVQSLADRPLDTYLTASGPSDQTHSRTG